MCVFSCVRMYVHMYAYTIVHEVHVWKSLAIFVWVLGIKFRLPVLHKGFTHRAGSLPPYTLRKETKVWGTLITTWRRGSTNVNEGQRLFTMCTSIKGMMTMQPWGSEIWRDGLKLLYFSFSVSFSEIIESWAQRQKFKNLFIHQIYSYIIHTNHKDKWTNGNLPIPLASDEGTTPFPLTSLII